MDVWQHRLVDCLHEEVGEHLRSVIHYHQGGYDLLFVRDDIDEQYPEEAVEAIVQELGIETIEKQIKERLYAHGDLEFTVMWFENGVELFVHIGEMEGVAIGLDPEGFGDRAPFVDRCFEGADFGT